MTARNFAYAIDRAANHDLASPGAQFITDPKGTEIVGAKDVNEGNGDHVTGVRVRGNRLIINLTRPDSSFLSKITMPFFQATSRGSRSTARSSMSAASPTFPRPARTRYPERTRRPHVAQAEPVLGRGPGRTRPRNLAGLDLRVEPERADGLPPALEGELDEGPVPATAMEFVGKPVRGEQDPLLVEAVNCTGYLALNMANHLFKGNPKLRQAINYAISRREYVAQAGPYAGQPWTHIFNPGVPGWKNVNPYPIEPDLPKARALAAGHFRDGKITLYYRSSGTTNPAQAAIVRQDLINLGFESQNITMKPFSGSDIYDPWGDAETTRTWVCQRAGARTIRIRTTGSTSSSTAASFSPRTTSTTRTWTTRGGTGRWRPPRSSSGRSD